jgi:iron(III) transport system ATP-binding protein
MRDGQIVQAADPQTLYRDPVDSEVAVFVGDAVLLEGRLMDGFAETALGRLPTRGAEALAVVTQHVVPTRRAELRAPCGQGSRVVS